MEQNPFVSIEEMMRDTGFTKREIFNDIRAERIRGVIHRGKAIVHRADWDVRAYMAGEQPRPRTAGITSIGKKVQAA